MGIIRAEVTSFRRLAHRVLQETGGRARPHLGELSKRMLLRALLEDLRPQLRSFAHVASQPGFTQLLASTISVLKAYGVSPSHLNEVAQLLAGSSPGPLADKLNDLALLNNALTEAVSGRYTDPDDYLDLLSDHLPQAASLKGAEFWIDGFAGFTPQEYTVLGQILTCVHRVNLTLCLDGRCSGKHLLETDVFHPTWTTLKRIRALAADRNIQEDAPVLLDDSTPARFHRAPDIRYLEQALCTRFPQSLENEAPNIHLVAAADRRAEVEGVARTIIHLARDQGLRWRNMAVITRDLERYHELIGSVFTYYDIPFFIDRKRPVPHHPVVELLRAALDVAVRGWVYEPVFRYLKTDLVPLSRDDVDQLENYVLAHGINGRRWTDNQPWHFRRYSALHRDEEPETPLSADEETELTAVNAARRLAVRDLEKFCQAARVAPDVCTLTQALFMLLESLGVGDILQRWQQEAAVAGRLDEAQEHTQVWNGVLEVMDQLVQALGNRSLTLEEYARVFDSGLESLRLGLIPPALDQVLVGSLDRSRSHGLLAAFLVGVEEGVLPARPADDLILNDADRLRLLEMGMELPPDGRRRLLDEQFLVYTALTRSSRYLWVSYPMANNEGGVISPSPVFRRLQQLLPAVTVESCPGTPTGTGDIDFVTRPAPALAHLLERLRAIRDGETVPPLWWAVYNWFHSQPSWAPFLDRLSSSLFYVNQASQLKPLTSRQLFGHPVQTSVSRLERFRACPFAHFLAYGLRLRERPVQRLAPPDMGRFLHAAMEQFAGSLLRDNRDWGALSANECAALAERIVDDLAPQLQSEVLLATARHRYLTVKLRNTVERAALVLGEHARRSRFRPVALEMAFGPDGPLPPFRLPGVELSGRIDRIDAAGTEKGPLLRIIDYKSGRARLSLTEIAFGLQIQLLIYLDVALNNAERIMKSTGGLPRPAGIFYFTLQNPLLRESGPMNPDEVNHRLLRALRMHGYVLADRDVVAMMDSQAHRTSDLIPVQLTDQGFSARSSVLTSVQFTLLRQHLRDLLIETAEAIASGHVEISPYRIGNTNACLYCPFAAVCAFDRQIPGNNYRILPQESSETFWMRLEHRYKDTIGRGCS